MKFIEQLPSSKPIEFSEETKQTLEQYFAEEIEDGFSARGAEEQIWRECLKRYDGTPKNPVRNVPIENAPNIEVPIGAIASDSIYAQIIDLIYQTSPMVTVRATNEKFAKHSKAFQEFTNRIVSLESNVRPSSEHTILDHVQLGTGVYYVPWVQGIKKQKTRKVIDRGPRVLTIPLEDLLVPGGAYDDPQQTRWTAIRFWYTKTEVEERAKEHDWDISEIAPAANVDWVRAKRESMGKTFAGGEKRKSLYEIMDIYAYCDVDEDGVDEDVLFIWDRNAKKILKAFYNPYDHRPIEVSRYQLRSHLFYGLGVLEMLTPFQDEVSDIHNHRTLNMMIANCRIWKARWGAVPSNLKMWPNKIIDLQDPEDLKPEAMGDVYPSAAQAQAITMSLAERRAGVNEMSMPRPSQVLGARTPGITALSLLQQVNKRFTPAFDSIRLATAGAIKQCLYRYHERILAKDKDVEQHLLKLLGEEDASLVVEVLSDEEFEDGIAVEITASSASVNREADRQNAVILVNILTQYYERTLQLMSLASNPQTPEPVREVAKKIAEKAGEVIERTIRTFDQVRDPREFVISVGEQIDSIQGLNQQGLQGLGQLIQNIAGGMIQGGPPNGAAMGGAA